MSLPTPKRSPLEAGDIALTALIFIVLTPTMLLEAGWVTGALRAILVTLVAAGTATSVLTGLQLLSLWRGR